MATDSSRIILGLPSLPSDGLPPELWDDFKTVYNAIRNIADGVSVYAGVDAPSPAEWADSPPSKTILTSNLTRLYVVASVPIAAGQVLNLFNNAGVLNARLASASSFTTMGHAIANTAAAAGQIVEAQYMQGLITSIGGMVIGDTYWLSTIAGAVQNAYPVAAGTIRQALGFATDSSVMLMHGTLSYQQN
jgi:hypothetical protein